MDRLTHSLMMAAAQQELPALLASVSPTSIAYSGSLASPTTGTVTCTASGGVPGYTYAWTRVSGSTLVSATAPTSAATAFTTSGMTTNTTRSAVFNCTVTDSAGQTVTTNNVSVSLTRQASPVFASISPTTGYSANFAGSGTQSPPYAYSASGGVPPYTWSWSRTSGSTQITPFPGPNPQTSVFLSGSGMAVGETRTATFRGRAEDSVGTSDLTTSITISFTRTG